MIRDIFFAFGVALFFQLFSITGIMFKRLLTIMCCITIISVYFYYGYSIINPFKMDFLIWILFVIIFDQILKMILTIFGKHVVETKFDENKLTEYMYETLKDHVGHNIVYVSYGDSENPSDICIECETCNCVLVSSEDFDRRIENLKDLITK